MDSCLLDLEWVECMKCVKLNLLQAMRTICLEHMKMKRIIDLDLERVERVKRNLERVKRMIVLEQVERKIDLKRMMECMIDLEHKTDLERIKRNLERMKCKLERMNRIIDLDLDLDLERVERMKPIIDLEGMINEFVRCFLLLGLEGRTALFGRERYFRLSRLVDVYIKDRHPLVKQILTTQLYDSLDLLGLRDFLANELGNSFSSIVKIAIHSAKVHIAILSKTSQFLPDHVDLLKMAHELVRMLESNCKSIPVFYHEELQKLCQRNCQMSKNPVGQGLHNQVKEFKRGRFGQLVQNLEKQCTLQGKKRRKP